MASSSVSHQAFLNPHNPKEFLSLDISTTLEEAQKMFNDPMLAEQVGKFLQGMPEVTFWQAASGWAFYDDSK